MAAANTTSPAPCSAHPQDSSSLALRGLHCSVYGAQEAKQGRRRRCDSAQLWCLVSRGCCGGMQDRKHQGYSLSSPPLVRLLPLLAGRTSMSTEQLCFRAMSRAAAVAL